MDLIFLDFETYYSSKDKYGLKNMSLTEYIRHPKFKVLGLGTLEANRACWLKPEEVQGWTKEINWSKTAIVAHNVKFDGAILTWIYNVHPAAYYDTQALARAVLGPSIDGYSLKRLAEYIGLQPKGELKTDGLTVLTIEQEKQLADYCTRDVAICYGIWEKLKPQFPDKELFHMDWTARAFIKPCLVLDGPRLQQAVKNEHERREQAISATGISRENLSSNSKFANVVRKAGFTVPFKISPRTGLSIPAFARGDVGLRNLETLSPILYAGRLAAKSSLLETRGLKLYEISKTGSWPFDIQYSGAIQTHRYSGGGGAGGNPQNLPRIGPLRESICSPKGFSLIVGDFAQIEARIVAWLANEPKLMAAFSEQRDVYSEFASTVYGRLITKQDNPRERMFGKTCILGLGYGMGWAKFQAKVKQDVGEDINEEEAKRVVKLYRETYFNIPSLWNKCEKLLPLMAEGRRNIVPFAPFMAIGPNHLLLPSGLSIQYPNLRKFGTKFGHPAWVYDHYIRRYIAEPTDLYGGKLLENISQALAGEICKIAIKRAVDAGVKCVGQVHDEILVVEAEGGFTYVPSEAADELKKCMEAAIPWFPTLKLKAEVSYGNNWIEAKL